MKKIENLVWKIEEESQKQGNERWKLVPVTTTLENHVDNSIQNKRTWCG